uniref:hypothetical protein n=1 Tax=Ningiella ruwaisensis TaxID=2364274 RepID=UPI0010A05B5D|nr:hypothetical protein [Ningiella ruwaisensis]
MNRIKAFIASVALSVSAFGANAAVISFDDIAGGVSGVTVAGPSGYAFNNIDALLDGNFSTTVAMERFTGIGPGVSPSDPITISASFDDLFTVESFGIATDWGSKFEQQIESLTLTLFDDMGGSTSLFFSGLVTGSFATIDLWTGSFVDAIGFQIDITGLQNTNVEIRELVMTGTKQMQAVSAPALGGLLSLILALGFLRRK